MAVSHVYSNAFFNEISKYVAYDPDTGQLTWLVKRTLNSKANVGDSAGTLDKNGYIRVTLNGKKYRVHRIAFLFMGQPIPEQVDHINGNKQDNRWENLRPANFSINAKNAKKRQDNKSGHTGVSYSVTSRKWRARVNENGTTRYLGVFPTLEEASNAVLEARQLLNYSSRHGT